MEIPLEYAHLPRTVHRRTWVGLMIGLDIAAALFVLSQVAFLVVMMGFNIRVSGVRPYGGGSSYRAEALGNAAFVQSSPELAGWIERLPSGLQVIGGPAGLAHLLTCTTMSYAMTVYFLIRACATRHVWRLTMLLLAGVMIWTIPWMTPAMEVALGGW